MSQHLSRKTLQSQINDALWREALARLVIDRLRACIDDPLDKYLAAEADDAELTYRLVRDVCRAGDVKENHTTSH